MIYLFVASQLLLSVAAVAYGRFKARLHPERDHVTALKPSRRLLLAILPLGLLVVLSVTALAYDPFCQLWPLTIQRFGSFVTWFSIGALLAGLSGYTWALGWSYRHPERRALTVAVLLLQVAMPINVFVYARPVAPDLHESAMSDGVVLQTTGHTCAPASLANVAKYFDLDVSERDAAALLLTSRLGTSAGPLRYGIAAIGLLPRTMSPEQCPSLSDVRPPAVLFVDHPDLGHESHAVAYMRRVDDGYEIWDPLHGKETWSERTAEERWHGNGVSCELP